MDETNVVNLLQKLIDGQTQMAGDISSLTGDISSLKDGQARIEQRLGRVEQRLGRVEQRLGSVFEMNLRALIVRQYGEKYAEQLMLKSLYDVVARLAGFEPHLVSKQVDILSKDLLSRVRRMTTMTAKWFQC